MSAGAIWVGSAPRLLEQLPARPDDAEFEPLQIREAPHLAAEPAAHLRAGVARGEADELKSA